ncbi:exo-alpha-sialidase [Microdochium nivale]|nr:exo-alpha-sialidase [Microdochium nivale]
MAKCQFWDPHAKSGSASLIQKASAIEVTIIRLYVAVSGPRTDNLYMSTSSNGIEWTAPQPTELPNPNAGICLDVLESGRVLVVYNHSSRADAQGRREGLYNDIASASDDRRNQDSTHAGKEAFWGAPRAPLNLAWSDDGGASRRMRVLEDGDGFCMTNNSEHKLNRELSYPSIARAADGSIHIAFTFWRQKIKHVVFDPSVLEKG